MLVMFFLHSCWTLRSFYLAGTHAKKKKSLLWHVFLTLWLLAISLVKKHSATRYLGVTHSEAGEFWHISLNGIDYWDHWRFLLSCLMVIFILFIRKEKLKPGYKPHTPQRFNLLNTSLTIMLSKISWLLQLSHVLQPPVVTLVKQNREQLPCDLIEFV